MCLQYTGLQYIQVILTNISCIGTLFEFDLYKILVYSWYGLDRFRDANLVEGDKNLNYHQKLGQWTKLINISSLGKVYEFLPWRTR